MAEIIVPVNIKAFRADEAEEMSQLDPQDESKVSTLDATALVPVEVLTAIEDAANKRGVALAQYIVDVAYRQSLDDLTGSVND